MQSLKPKCIDTWKQSHIFLPFHVISCHFIVYEVLVSEDKAWNIYFFKKFFEPPSPWSNELKTILQFSFRQKWPCTIKTFSTNSFPVNGSVMIRFPVRFCLHQSKAALWGSRQGNEVLWWDISGAECSFNGYY